MTLLRPEWLLALPLLAGFAWWLSRQAGGLGGWERATDPALLRAMAAMGRVSHSGRRRGGAIWLAASLILLALGGPAVERRDTVSFRNLDAAIFVLEATPDVVDGPIWPQVQALGRQGIAALGTRPGGLVIYAGDAYVASDVTGDLQQLGQTLSLIGPETVPDEGQRADLGLAMALRMLEQTETRYGDVILLARTVGPEAARMADRFTARGARLSVVALGAQDLSTVAQAGGGRSFLPTEGAPLARWLSTDGRAELLAQDYPLLYWRDMGPWILAIALLPLLTLFRRRAG
ncbi:VWA domain-containing protein [Sagittula sp. NFXS13]|uniref:VWA domain-containing protein n=1 Tax=Sagittula sp. NFXS13 TaxID=2819095 RepID=UPI0032DFD70E